MDPMNSDFAAGSRSLRRLIDATPIIDNHAHPLLNVNHIDKHPLLAIVSEAHGEALASSRTSLAHIRAAKQLSHELGCDESWHAVQDAMQKQRASEAEYERWTRRCLSGIECVLVDDGLDNEDTVEPCGFFDRFTPSPSKRILRVEHVAAKLIEKACLAHQTAEKAFEAAMNDFDSALAAAIADEDVVGFKSVICYRTGLDVAPAENKSEALRAFAGIFSQRRALNASPFTRVDHRPLNHYLVHRLAQAIRDATVAAPAPDDTGKKPIQFHTGLGDNDLTLTRSSPAHLQDFVRAYPTVPMVLLHSGYPFDRETGYMAAMYANVYADIGAVFPFVSRSGQEDIVRHVLELCPWEKIIWSTDGHWFPETFLLAVVQMKDVLHNVLCDFVRKGDISWEHACKMVQEILFHTSNKLYHLGLTLKHDDDDDEEEEVDEKEEDRPAQRKQSGHHIHHDEKHLLESLCRLKTDMPPPFVRLYWIDYTGTSRLRVISLRRALSILRSGKSLTFSVTEVTLALLQNDTLPPDTDPSGAYRLEADAASLRQGPKPGNVMLMCDFTKDDGTPAVLCPRRSLKAAIQRAREHNMELTFGFEIELVLVRFAPSGRYELLGADGHAWSTARATEHEVFDKVLEPAIRQLDAAGVYVEMLHAESAKGQFEIVLPAAPALEAVDTLVFAREVLSACASAHGYRMTLHPKPVADACGTAAHAHMSLTTTTTTGSSPPDVRSSSPPSQAVYESFYAGILYHLRAICAFTYSNLVSYERVQDGVWAGGTWVTWGTQNREAPLRKIADSHWEVKCLDGLANPYLAMAALISAGVNGVANQEKLVWGDCTRDPASLSWEERLDLGINSNLPASIEEALACLDKDEEMSALMGHDLVQRYVEVKKAETKLLRQMDGEARKKWIIDRY
ncbi:hypothetical protein E4U42_007926 [Claviceps africana]|uniref:Glutamine synthetase n=1 Tax=Claviceps africana TaxID=83212 RepID=A0A8K0J198_9HYPO|nr:hypothetical protein E4U42_007926 [Claviceps africana]